MDVLKTLDHADSAFFALTCSKDNNIVGFYLNKESELQLKWIYRSDDLTVTEIRDFNMLENALFSISVTTVENNLLKLIFGLEIFEMDDYYIIQDPFRKGSKCIFFLSLKEGPSIAREVYVDLKDKLAFCKCQTETKQDFVELKTLSKNLNFF